MNAKATPALASPGRAALYLRVSTGRQAEHDLRFRTSAANFRPIAKQRASPSSPSLSSRAHRRRTTGGPSFSG